MPTTHDDNVTTWRDLADELTPKQVDGFERMERMFAEDGIGEHEAKTSLLAYARDYVQHNLIDAIGCAPRSSRMWSSSNLR